MLDRDERRDLEHRVMMMLGKLPSWSSFPKFAETFDLMTELER